MATKYASAEKWIVVIIGVVVVSALSYGIGAHTGSNKEPIVLVEYVEIPSTHGINNSEGLFNMVPDNISTEITVFETAQVGNAQPICIGAVLNFTEHDSMTITIMNWPTPHTQYGENITILDVPMDDANTTLEPGENLTYHIFGPFAYEYVRIEASDYDVTLVIDYGEYKWHGGDIQTRWVVSKVV